MTDEPKKDQGKERRGSPSEKERKGVNVRLTPSEHKFFTDASNVLGKSLAVIFRQGGQEYVEKNSDLRMNDYLDKDNDEG
jgi:DNA-binding MarR family transcriptional regulator